MFRLSSEFALSNWLVGSASRPARYIFALHFSLSCLPPSPQPPADIWLKFMPISFALSLQQLPHSNRCCAVDFLKHFSHLPLCSCALPLSLPLPWLSRFSTTAPFSPPCCPDATGCRLPIASSQVAQSPVATRQFCPLPALTNFEFDFIVMISIVPVPVLEIQEISQ